MLPILIEGVTDTEVFRKGELAMGMRVGGLATGMDIDGIVNDLMQAERIPLDKLEQDKITLEWQRDAFRDVNAMFLELDQMMLDMKLSRTYNTKMAIASNTAVTTTANSTVPEGSYRIAVKGLATSAINATANTISMDSNNKVDPFSSLHDQQDKLLGQLSKGFPTEIKFKTYHNGEEIHRIPVTEQDSLNDILNKITNQDNGVRAFYDVQSDRVIMERTSTGAFNSIENGPEIDFSVDDSDFFTQIFGMTDQETAGKDATFEYNGIELTSKTNTTTLNGLTFTFNDITDNTYINITNDIDHSFDQVMNFVNKYNETIEKVNNKLREDSHRDHQPLTNKQMDDMSDREIELWEEKARSGLLRRDPILSSALSEMRQAWSGSINNGGKYTHFSQIGISTTAKYLDGGMLEVDEDTLRSALQEDATAVYQLFSNASEGDERGLINRLEDAVSRTTNRINQQAGRTTHQPHQYALGRRLDGIDDRIVNFERRLKQIEDRYWRQFTAMESAIQRMNEQSNFLFSQFNQS